MTTIPAAGPPKAGRWEMFSALRHANFRMYWFGQLSSVMGQNMQYVAQAWLVLDLTGSPLLLGLTGLANAIPSIGFSLLGGTLADRMDRRRLLRITQGAQIILYGVLGTLAVTNLVQVWHVMAFAFLAGLCRAFDQPARQAIVPQVVPPEVRPQALALSNTIWQFSRLVGPALAGALLAFWGTGPTFYVASIGFLVFFLLMFRIRLYEGSGGSRRSGLGNELVEGLRFIRGNQLVYTLIGLTFFNSVFGMSYSLMLPVIAREVLGVGSIGYGMLQTVGAVGALAGTLGVAYMAETGRRGMQALGGATLFGLLLIAFAYSQWYPVSMGLILLLGIANQLYMTTVYTVLQMHVPDELRGRVMGVYGLTWSMTPFGGTIGGTIAEFAGVQAAVAFGGFMVASMAIAVAVWLPRVRRIQ